MFTHMSGIYSPNTVGDVSLLVTGNILPSTILSIGNKVFSNGFSLISKVASKDYPTNGVLVRYSLILPVGSYTLSVKGVLEEHSPSNPEVKGILSFSGITVESEYVTVSNDSYSFDLDIDASENAIGSLVVLGRVA